MKKIILVMLMVVMCVGCGTTSQPKKDNAGTAKIKDETITDVTYKKLKFDSVYGDEQINVNIENVSDETIDINTIIIKVYDKHGDKNDYKIPLDISLGQGETTNTTFAYRIEDIKEIKYSYN